MPLFFIRTTNCNFVSRDDGGDYEQAEHALAFGVRGALQIANDEMKKGGESCAVEVAVEGYDGTVLLRSAVAMSVSRLMADTRVFMRL
jgi:hypothetical protein